MEMNSSGALIELKDLSRHYRIGDELVKANDKINLRIYSGEFAAIIGKSGSGKSTTMNIIGALDQPTEGQYFLDGMDVSHMKDDELAKIRNNMLGFIFQQYHLLPRLNVLENVELPLLYAGIGKNERKTRTMDVLKQVGIEDKWNKLPKQLSGGQQQRVSIARALAGRPSLILADEPTGALDSKTTKEVLAFLKELNKKGNTIVLITHDNSVAMEADRIIRLSDGRILFDGKREDYSEFLNEGERK